MERATDHRQHFYLHPPPYKNRAPCLPPLKIPESLLKFFSLLLPTLPHRPALYALAPAAVQELVW
jgi:hypothetical protein